MWLRKGKWKSFRSPLAWRVGKFSRKSSQFVPSDNDSGYVPPIVHWWQWREMFVLMRSGWESDDYWLASLSNFQSLCDLTALQYLEWLRNCLQTKIFLLCGFSDASWHDELRWNVDKQKKIELKFKAEFQKCHQDTEMLTCDFMFHQQNNVKANEAFVKGTRVWFILRDFNSISEFKVHSRCGLVEACTIACVFLFIDCAMIFAVIRRWLQQR